MLATDHFIWLHFGKTGGTSTRAALKTLFPECRSVSDRLPIKHGSLGALYDRKLLPPSELPILVGFRRLRSWVESHLRQQTKNGIPFGNEHLKNAIAGRLQLGANSPARKMGLFQGVESFDDLLAYYSTPQPHSYIRVEYLRADFQRVLGEILGSDLPFTALERAFKQRLNVAPESTSILNDNQVSELYASCPRWAALERRLYEEPSP